jgi:hypothetical protein
MREGRAGEDRRLHTSLNIPLQQDCLDIVFQFGDKLDAIEGTVFITNSDERIEIATPYKAKTFWYETWLELKKFYGI